MFVGVPKCKLAVIELDLKQPWVKQTRNLRFTFMKGKQIGIPVTVGLTLFVAVGAMPARASEIDDLRGSRAIHAKKHGTDAEENLAVRARKSEAETADD
jgi:hypothetical protein